MHRKFPRILILAVPLLCLTLVFLYQLPPVQDRLAWRIDSLWARVRHVVDPPGQEVFVPEEQVNAIVQATLQALTPAATASPTVALAPAAPGDTATPQPSLTPTLSPTPLPPSARLAGIVQVYQNYNNCGPATLSMYLTYWNWPPDKNNYAQSEDKARALQNAPAAYLKPEKEDKNVMPYEIADYVNTQTNLRAIVRVGGELDLLKSFLANGLPVMIEKGFEGDTFDGWMGHYEVVSGYDEAKQQFLVFDSYVGPGRDFPISYDEIQRNWRAFNYTYILVYPPEKETQVMAILGPQADETYNFQYAAQKASDEIYALSDRDQYFAWFNRGSSLVKLQDYAGAAEAYDQTAAIYANIPVEKRPWRMLWYQTGPYFAYYYSGRYLDVISLAMITLKEASDPRKSGGPYIEETYYWLGMARLKTGDTSGAIEDFQKTLKLHPGFDPSLQQLQALGVGG